MKKNRIKTDIYKNGRISSFRTLGRVTQTRNVFGLSGGGDVGKSHPLTTVYQGIIHTLREAGQNPSQTNLLLTAPTRTAAFNIRGMTILESSNQRKTNAQPT